MAYDALVGTQLANYYIEYPLGRGGMAMVYYATDVKLDRPAAIKVIDAQLQGNPSFAKRFVDEAKIVAQWRHENIVQVYYADNEDDLYFFAMEYISGASLEDLLETYVQKVELIPQVDVVRIGRAIASALDYAHQHGVIHRDIKPSNVMISMDDRVILTDFGLALDTAQGTMGEVFGTPHYIAPEQALHSAKAVPTSDLYSLGVVLYQMLTGFVPFDDDSATSIAVQHIQTPPPSPRSWNPALNQATEEVLLKALEKDPQNRYQSGKALMDALEAALLNKAVSETPQVDSNLPMPPVRKGASTTNLKQSMHSISEIIRLELEARETPAPTPPAQRKTAMQRVPPPTQHSVLGRTQAPPPTAKSTAAESASSAASSGNNRNLVFGAVGLVAVLAIAVIAFMFMQNGDTGGTPTALPTQLLDTLNTQIVETQMAAVVPTDAPTDEPISEPTTVPSTDVPVVVPTDTVAAATNTDVPPTNTNVPATNTVAPTNTSIPPTNTNMPTFTAIPPTAIVGAPATAVAFPDGNLLQLNYSPSTFYIRNMGSENVRVSRLAFQAVDGDGNLLFYRFDGGEWARNYSFVERNGNCVGMEIADRGPWNRPGECGRMNSLITPSPSDERIFWAEAALREGAVAFAVFWDGEEIARCPITIGACDVRVGS
jgi:serine/threonine protein kinase